MPDTPKELLPLQTSLRMVDSLDVGPDGVKNTETLTWQVLKYSQQILQCSSGLV